MPKILVAVLDWGIGHASRSAPVIESLLAHGAKVVIASSGNALNFLRIRFPSLDWRELPSKQMEYNKRGARNALFRRMISQPGINTTEHKWANKLVQTEYISGIISDNIYGAWSSSVPSVIITHQLNLPIPFFQKFLNAQLARWLNNFDAVWIPDTKGEGSISKSLSAQGAYKGNKAWLGILSRFNSSTNENIPTAAEKKYNVVALLSGPEPQRSMLEAELTHLFKKLHEPTVIVQGRLGGNGKTKKITENLSIIPFLDGHDLAELLISAEVVIARSGYSTLCDLYSLGCHAVLVPTPQQPEQLYLAKHCHNSGWSVAAKQGTISAAHIQGAKSRQYKPIEKSNVDAVVNQFLENIGLRPS